MAVPIRVGVPGTSDPAGPYVLKSVAARLDGDVDLAEDWLNVAAQVFRELGVPNTSRLYRRESRNVAWARFRMTEVMSPDDYLDTIDEFDKAYEDIVDETLEEPR